MNVLGHNDTSENVEAVFAAALFQRMFEEVAGSGCLQVRSAVITANGDGVVMVEVLITLQPVRHVFRLGRGSCLSLCHRSGVPHHRRGLIAAKVGLVRGGIFVRRDCLELSGVVGNPP